MVQVGSFVSLVPNRVLAKSKHGSPSVVNTAIAMTNVTLGDPGQVSVDIDLPINTPTRIHAWRA